MAMAIISNQQCACLRPLISQAGWYECDSSWEHHQRGSGLRYYGIRKNLRYSLRPFPVVCPLFASVAASVAAWKVIGVYIDKIRGYGTIYDVLRKIVQ